MSILDCVPKGFSLRPGQAEILLDVEKVWRTSDVIVLPADTGAGKSLILQTIARWQERSKKTTATITPRVSLQEQYGKSFPTVPILYGAARYQCHTTKTTSCGAKKKAEDSYCGNCVYTEKRDLALKSSNAIFNLQSFLYNNKDADVLLIDEAHTLFSMLGDMATLKLWKSQVGYPCTPEKYEDILMWIEKAKKILEQEKEYVDNDITLLRKNGQDVKEFRKESDRLDKEIRQYEKCAAHASVRPPIYFIEEIEDENRGKKDKALLIRPKTLEGLGSWLFAGNNMKIVLASATISQLDVQKTGLSHLRVSWIKTKSAIPSDNRPIQLEFVGNMGYKYQDKNMPKLAKKVVELQERHKDTKGMVHLTYGMAKKLRGYLAGPTYMWHTPSNKEDQLKVFRKAPAGTVFIACGMAEGVDLAGPDYGWQAIAKIQYPSMADQLVAHWYKNDGQWITWVTARTLMQQAGRICRGPEDYGVTYILDSCFGNPKMKQFGLLQKASKYLPDYFKERIVV